MLAGILSSCEPTYPAKTIESDIVRLVKDENKLDVTAHLSGKTLWVYLPLENLVSEKDLTWQTEGVETLGNILSICHRVILSTDAELDFLAVAATDIKYYGVQLITYEYIPDVKEAIMEKFSRGEFFSRSIKDVTVNPAAIGDKTGESTLYYDMTFDHFLGLQVIHRAKSVFAKDKTLNKIFEIRSTSLTEKFGTIKVDIEFLKKTYDLTPEEAAINPIDTLKMIAAQVGKNYNWRNFQAFELKDTFSGDYAKLDIEALKQIKVKLPEFME